MVVEPERLCWLAGRRLDEALPGAAGAEELGRRPALEQVAREGGNCLGRGDSGRPAPTPATRRAGGCRPTGPLPPAADGGSPAGRRRAGGATGLGRRGATGAVRPAGAVAGRVHESAARLLGPRSAGLRRLEAGDASLAERAGGVATVHGGGYVEQAAADRSGLGRGVGAVARRPLRFLQAAVTTARGADVLGRNRAAGGGPAHAGGGTGRRRVPGGLASASGGPARSDCRRGRTAWPPRGLSHRVGAVGGGRPAGGRGGAQRRAEQWAGAQSGGVRQQRVAPAAGAAPEVASESAGPEAAVREQPRLAHGSAEGSGALSAFGAKLAGRAALVGPAQVDTATTTAEVSTGEKATCESVRCALLRRARRRASVAPEPLEVALVESPTNGTRPLTCSAA
jgi:hypothetical protein